MNQLVQTFTDIELVQVDCGYAWRFMTDAYCRDDEMKLFCEGHISCTCVGILGTQGKRIKMSFELTC